MEVGGGGWRGQTWSATRTISVPDEPSGDRSTLCARSVCSVQQRRVCNGCSPSYSAAEGEKETRGMRGCDRGGSLGGMLDRRQ